MNKEQKKDIVKDINDKFLRSKVVLVTDYKGLNVVTIGELRKKLREAEAEYHVVKNTFLTRASEGTDVAVIKDYFKGPSAVAISYDDPVTPAKVLTDFAKINKKFEIKAGAMGGKALSMSEINALSVLPSREELLSSLLGTLHNIPASFVRTLSAVPAGLLNVLEAVKEQKQTA